MIYVLKIISFTIIALSLTINLAFAQSTSKGNAGVKSTNQREYYRVSKAARSAETKGDFEAALKYWSEVNRLKPGYLSAYKGIRRSLTNLKRYKEAITFIDTMLTAARSGTIRLDPLTIMADRVDIYISRDGHEDSQDKIEEVLIEYRGNLKIYQELSNILAAHRLSDEAIAMLYRGRMECDQEYLYARNLARWFESRMDWEAAVKEHLLFLYESDKNQSFVVGALGDIDNKPNSDSIAVQIVMTELAAQGPNRKIALRKLLASLHFRAGRFKAALTQYQILDSQSEDQGRDLLNFAKLTLIEGEFQFAREAFDQILLSNPKGKLWADVMLGKGEALAGLGKLDSAAIIYKQTIEPGIPPLSAFEAYSRLGTLDFEHRRNLKSAREYLQKAHDIGTKIKLSNKVLDNIQVKIALTYEFENDLERTEKILKKMIRQRGTKRNAAQAARFELARLYFRQGNIDKAEEMANSLLLAAPSSEYANEMLRMKALFNDLKSSSDVITALGLADLARFQGEYTVGEDILADLSADADGFIREEIEWRRYELFSEAGFDSVALNALENIIILNESLRRDLALFTAGELYSKVFRDNEIAIEMLERILTEHPDSLLVDAARHLIRRLSEKDI